MMTKTNKHHDGAGVNDDLNDRHELRPQQQIHHRQRAEHHNQGKRAVDRRALQHHIQRGQNGYGGENVKENGHKSRI